MQTETHYTSKVAGSNGAFHVVRKVGNVKVALVTKAHLGWDLDLGAGIRRTVDRKTDAFFIAVNHDNNNTK